MLFKKTILFSLCYAAMINSMESSIVPKSNKSKNDCPQVIINAANDCCKMTAKSICLPIAICLVSCLFHNCECPEGEDGAPICSRTNKFKPSTPK